MPLQLLSRTCPQYRNARDWGRRWGRRLQATLHGYPCEPEFVIFEIRKTGWDAHSSGKDLGAAVVQDVDCVRAEGRETHVDADAVHEKAEEIEGESERSADIFCDEAGEEDREWDGEHGAKDRAFEALFRQPVGWTVFFDGANDGAVGKMSG